MELKNGHLRWRFSASALGVIKRMRGSGELIDRIVIEEVGGPDIFVEGCVEDVGLLRMTL